MGAYINFSDTEFQRTPVPIRIIGLKEYVNNPYSPQIELSNKVQGHSFASEMRKLQNQEVYFGELNKRTQSLTKRSWRDAQETIKQIEAAFPEYTKSIVPATVQTMMALIGNKSTQFDFVVSKTNPIKAPHTLYFDKNTKQINAGSGWLKHFTLGTTDINPNRNANSYKYWNIPAFVSGRLDDKAKTYYLYIKASKTAETGEFILSENKIDIEQEAGFYHFLYATVNSEYEGERGIAKLNGFTEITGGQIKTDKITSGNGQQYIHLFDDHIEIKANLKITDGNKTEIKQIINPDLQSLENKLKQYSDGKVETAKTATEAYARAQAELTKAQAIAEADGKITEAEQRQIQQLQLKLQEAKTFAQQKVDELNIGGRNLILNSKPRITQTFSVYGWVKSYNLSQNLEVGETYVLKFKNYKTEPFFFLWETGWGDTQEIYNGIPFTAKIAYKILYIHTKQVPYECDFEMIKLERGNKPTDWSPAPEDIENKVADIQTDLTTAINNAKAQIEAEKRNIENSNARIQKLENKTQIFSDTQIDGNVVATGTLIVGNTQGTKAGITGMGMTNDSIRFWAGEPDKTQPIETPQQAEERRRKSAFLVQEDGTLITKSIKAEGGIISGRLKMTSGSIYSGDWDERQNRVISGSAYTGSGVIYREDENDIQAFFGGIASNTYTATKSLLSLYRNPKKPKGVESIGKFTGVNISIPPNPNDVIDTISYENNRAQIINGDTISLGANAQFEYVYNGIAESSTIKRWLGITNKFVFRDVASDRHIVYLPNYFEVLEIMRKLGFNIIGRQSLSLSFELTVIMGMFVGGKMIRLQGVSSGSIIDNNGGAYNDGDGYIDMGKGDVVVLRLLGGEYHVVNTRFE